MTAHLKLVLLFLYSLCFAAATQAQEVTVTAHVKPSTCIINSPFQFVLTVKNGSVTKRPTELQLPLQLISNNVSSTKKSTSIINGVASSSTSYTWEIYASETGDFVIPAQTIEVNGQELFSNEVRLKCIDPSQLSKKNPSDPNTIDPEEPWFEIHTERKEFYEGEVVPIYAKVYLLPSNPLRSINVIEIPKSDIAISRFPRHPTNNLVTRNERQYHVYTYKSNLVALRSGSIVIPSANVEIQYHRENNITHRSPFGSFPGFSDFESVKKLLTSKPLQINVIPLPTEGKPLHFKGLVGSFNINITATPTKLKAGDPINLDLEISGRGNIDAVSEPFMRNALGWKTYPARRFIIDGQINQSQETRLDGSIGFTKVIIPESIHKEIPSFEISYFDPEQKAYFTKKTEPVPITIEAIPTSPEQQTNPSTNQSPTSLSQSSESISTPKPNSEQNDILEFQPAPITWINPSSLTASDPASTSSTLLNRLFSPHTDLLHNISFWLLYLSPTLLFIGLSFHKNQLIKKNWLAAQTKTILNKEINHLHSLQDPESTLDQINHLLQLTHLKDDLSASEINQVYNEIRFQEQSSAPSHQTLTKLKDLLLQTIHKKGLLSIFFSFVFLYSSQADTTPQESPYEKAIQLYQHGKFNDAQYLIETLLNQNPQHASPQLFELLGRCRYRLNDIGTAYLWFKRAQIAKLQQEELNQNLNYINKRQGSLLYPKPNFWLQAIQIFTHNQYAWASFFSILIYFCYRTYRLYFPNHQHRLSLQILHYSVWLFPILSVFFIYLSSIIPHGVINTPISTTYIITAPNAKCYSAASTISAEVISLTIGSEIKLLEKHGSWIYIEIPTENENIRGWIEDNELQPLWPYNFTKQVS